MVPKGRRSSAVLGPRGRAAQPLICRTARLLSHNSPMLRFAPGRRGVQTFTWIARPMVYLEHLAARRADPIGESPPQALVDFSATPTSNETAGNMRKVNDAR